MEQTDDKKENEVLLCCVKNDNWKISGYMHCDVELS